MGATVSIWVEEILLKVDSESIVEVYPPWDLKVNRRQVQSKEEADKVGVATITPP